jgi:CheY-like chemotaxis protein
MNLFDNAIKYSDRSKAQPVVFVGIVRLPNRVRIDIIDNGIGIPSHHWENVFKPFFQLGNTERDREKGLGLGLSIVKSIMLLLSEHRIDMRSVEGRGTRFSLDIPRTDDPGTFKIIKEAEQSPIGKDVSGLYVIYVEDDVLVRASTVALFQEYGILYEAIGSVSELEERLPLLERMPDLLITDYRLPGGGTAKNIMQLMSHYFDADIPAIVLTGEVQTSPTELIGAQVLSRLRRRRFSSTPSAGKCQRWRGIERPRRDISTSNSVPRVTRNSLNNPRYAIFRTVASSISSGWLQLCSVDLGKGSKGPPARPVTPTDSAETLDMRVQEMD